MGCSINLKKKYPFQNSLISKRVFTLYDFMEAIQEQVEPEDDYLVIDATIGSFKSGRVKFINKAEINN